MAVTYSSAAKQARLQAVIDLIDGSASPLAPGVLQIGTAGMASVLAEFTLTRPCGTASGGTLTFDFDPDISDTSANNSGTAAAARIRNSSGTDIITGLTVGVAGSPTPNVVLDSVSITAGQTVTIATAVITHA